MSFSLFDETEIPILRVVNLTGNLQVAAAVRMKRGDIQNTPDDVSPTISFSLRGLPDVLQRHIASFCTPKTMTYMSRLAKWTLCSRAWNLSKCRLAIPDARWESGYTVMPEDVLSVRRWLSRGQGACTSIRVEDSLRLELLASAIREDPSLGRQLTELYINHPELVCDDGSESVSAFMQVARLLQEDCVPALVELRMVCGEFRDDEAAACAGAAALFECLGRGVCPGLKDLSIVNPSYAFLPLLADALVLRGEVVKEGLESLGFRYPRADTFEGISRDELGAALIKLVQAPCLSKLQKLGLDDVALGSWAAAMYLNNTPSTEHIKELRIGLPADDGDEDDDEDDDPGVNHLITALAAGRAPRLKTLYFGRVGMFEGMLDMLCNAISQQGVLKHLEELSLDDFLTEEATTQLTTAVAIGCLRLQSLSYEEPDWASDCRNKVLAAALRASQHPLLFYKELTLYQDAGLRDIVDALQTNSQGLSAVTSLKIVGFSSRVEEGQETMAPEEVVTLLGCVMDRCPALENLEVYGAHARAVVAAMAPGGALAGGTQRITQLYVKSDYRPIGARDMETTLRALLAGACPRLREANAGLSARSLALPQEGQDALVALLAGEAPCSGTLHTLKMSAVLDAAHVRQLTERLRNHTAVQLKTIDRLRLEANLEDCMDFIGALALPHVGDKLASIGFEFPQVTIDEQELLKMEVARLIRAGAWPRLVGMGPGDRWDASISLGRGKLHEAVRHALEEKRREVEAACM